MDYVPPQREISGVSTDRVGKMARRGRVGSRNKYRNLAATLALTIVMLVAFAFASFGNLGMVHADVTVNNIDTWKKLSDAVETAEGRQEWTEIKITDDLVAVSQIVIKAGNKIRITSDSKKTIYREKGDTDFSVFKVNGELELGSSVCMSGDVATAQQQSGNVTSTTVEFNDGYGNVIKTFTINAGQSIGNALWNNGEVPGPDNKFKSGYVQKEKNWYANLESKLGTKSSSPYSHGYEISGWDVGNHGYWATDPEHKIEKITYVANWRKPNNTKPKEPLKTWDDVDNATRKDGFVLMGYVDSNDVLHLYGVQKQTVNGTYQTSRDLFKTFSEISSNNSVVDSQGLFRWYNTPAEDDPSQGFVRYANIRMLATYGIINPSNRHDFTDAQAFKFNTKTIHTNISPYTKKGGGFFGLGDQKSDHIWMSLDNGYLKAWSVKSNVTATSDSLNMLEDDFYVVRRDRYTTGIGLAKGTREGNITKVTSGNTGDWYTLGFYSLDQARILSGSNNTSYTPGAKTVTAGKTESTIVPGGKIVKNGNNESIHKAVEYVKANPLTDVQADNANQAHQEVFTSDKGFFVHVNDGGSLKLSGATLKDFRTLTIKTGNRGNIDKKVPCNVAPVYVQGGENTNNKTTFEMTDGEITGNFVGYVGIEEWTKDNTVQGIKNELKLPFTNTAGGVIFAGEKTEGTITGGYITGNKGDAGGIIVTDRATVILGQDSRSENQTGINGNLGFHHAGAALVEDGGKLEMNKTAQMTGNVTWAKGGAVWATEWGTNGYVEADWSNWPNSFPEVTNLSKKQPNGGGYFIMKGGNINDNTAFVRAGAIEVESNGVELYGGNIFGNNCRSLGGAIYVEGDAADYTYTLYVNQGYVHNNVAVQRTNTTAKSVNVNSGESTVNYVLDRYLDNGLLKYCEHGNGTVGTTYDRDFAGAMGNGGGIWLCPVGGTSVFAKGEKQVVIDTNKATGTGNDFYLCRGNGAVMVQNLNGDWYKEDGSGEKTGDKLQFDSENGTVLHGPLPMGNYADPPMTNSEGIQIYNNQSRDGGGIACNGTLMLGGPEDVFRYDARATIKKVWKTTLNPEEGTKVTFDLYYKENDQRIGGPVKSIELDGKKDLAQDNEGGSGQAGNQIGGQDIEGEWNNSTEGGNLVWNAGMLLPQYVEINGQRKSLYTFTFTDPDDPSATVTYDPTNENRTIRDKLFRAVQKEGGKLELNVVRNFDIVERGTGYTVAYEDLPATATATSKKITLQNPAANTTNSEFFVTFTTASFGIKATNKDAPIEIPVTKEWTDYDDNIIMSQGVCYNSGNIDYEFKDKNGQPVWVNWPQTWANNIKLRLTDDQGSFTQDDLMQVAGPAGVTIQKVIGGQENNGWQINTPGGKGRAEIQFDEREYYVVREKASGNKVVLTMLKSKAETGAANANITAGEYALQMAALKSGKAADDLELADNGQARKVYFPKLVYKVPKYDQNENLIKYVVKELGVQAGSNDNGRTDDYVPSYTDSNGKIVNMDGQIGDAAAHQDKLKKGITINNDRKVAVKVTKKWMDGSETSWPENIDGITFTLKRIGRTQKVENNKDLRRDKNGNKIPYRNDDGSLVEGYYEQYEEVSGQDDKKLTKEMWKAGTKHVAWTGLPKYDYSWFDNGSAGRENLHKNRYCVLEVTPDGYISEIPVEYTVTTGDNNREIFNFTAINKKLTEVEATKRWTNLQSNSWEIDVTFHLKRWYKYDSFATEMFVKQLSESVYISRNGNQYLRKDQTNNQYYIEAEGERHYVKSDAYVEINGMMYALQGGTNVKDHNDADMKVLGNAKDANGNEVSAKKATSADNRTVKWGDLPKYDDEIKVSDTLTAAQKKSVKKIMYWIEEEWIQGCQPTVSYKDDSEYDFNVLNVATQREYTDVPATKYWNDGDSETRPTIKFDLWRLTATYTRTSVHYGWGNSPTWSNGGNPSKMEGDEYEKIISSGPSVDRHVWYNLPVQEFSNNDLKYQYHHYAVREAVRVGKDSTGKSVFVYVSPLPDRTEIQTSGKIVATKIGNEYSVSVYKLDQNGNLTNTLIDGPVMVKELDENALAYNSKAVNFPVHWTSDGCGSAFGIKAYNTKPAIEKYVNKDVHKDLEKKDKVFTYDIMAYVPKDSKEVKIYDPLVKALEFVDKNGKKQSETGFEENDLVTVAYMDTNNHKAVSKDENGSVTKTGTILGTDKYSVGISRKPQKGYPLGSTTDTEYWSKLQNYIGLSDEQYENKLTVTIPESTLSGNTGENGKWVKVTFKAKIRDDIDFTGMTPEQRTALGFGQISENDPVDTEISSHTGFKNKASYDVTLTNGYTFEVDSNTVTVAPPTSLIIEKKVTGTLGDLNKEFVFHVKLTGLKNNGGKGNGSDKRDYYYGALVNGTPDETDKVKVYMDSDLSDANPNHRTYTNGFNVGQGDNVSKDLWVKLRAGQSLEIKDLPIGAKYIVTEWASDHEPSYNLTEVNTVVKETTRQVTEDDVTQGRLVKDENGKWTKATMEMVGQPMTVALNVKTKNESGAGKQLATTEETVDAGEIVIITYTNHRDIMTETGIIKDTWPWNIILLVVLIVLGYDDRMRKIKNRLRMGRATAL